MVQKTPRATDIIAIGDIVTDAFIRLQDASVHCKINQEECELCVRFGDKVPYESVEEVRAVGNSANAAVSAARLGLSVSLLTTMGDDSNGKNCLAELERNNVGTELVEISKDYPTNYHYVLWYDVERTILVKHAPFSYSLPHDTPPPKWFYLSSMGESSKDFHFEILDYLHVHPEVKLAFQPGTFQMKLGLELLRPIYARTDFLCVNIQEAQKILAETSPDPKVLMKKLADLGPKIVIVTDGINGAYAYDHGEMYFMPVYPHKPFERTGAGDAFASTLVSCLAKGMTLPDALRWAPINSMSVVLYVGAQKGLLTETQLKAFLTKAPEDYKIKKI